VVVDYKLTKKTGAVELLNTYSAQLQAYRAALHGAGLTPVGRLGPWSAAYGVAVWRVD
jgi:hypothetical protein